MKTRTLLLLSLASGLAIMLAGAVFLFQLAGQDEASPPVAIGVETRVGDMTVEVVSTSESDGVREVEVRIGGVVDADGAATFRLLTSDRVIGYSLASGAQGPDPCGATSADVETCWLRFVVGDSDGSSRQLYYARGDQSTRFVLD